MVSIILFSLITIGFVTHVRKWSSSLGTGKFSPSEQQEAIVVSCLLSNTVSFLDFIRLFVNEGIYLFEDGLKILIISIISHSFIIFVMLF